MTQLRGLAASVLAPLLLAGAAHGSPMTSSAKTTTSSSGTSTSSAASTPIVLPANPVFTNPDYNFAPTGATAHLANGSFSLSVATASGDLLSSNGKGGFTTQSGTLTVTGGAESKGSTSGSISFAQGGTVSLVTDGKTTLTGTLGALTLTQIPVGYEFSAAFKATGGSAASSFKSGGGVFGLLYNVTGSAKGGSAATGFSASAKGDLAALKGTSPIVPEPASLSLVLLGLSGLAAATRRKTQG